MCLPPSWAAASGECPSRGYLRSSRFLSLPTLPYAVGPLMSVGHCQRLCRPPQSQRTQPECWVGSLDLGPGQHSVAWAPAPHQCFLTGPSCPLPTGTSSTSSWMPPWACCSSTQVCAPSASWWSGSSGSPCASASMVRYSRPRRVGLPGGGSVRSPLSPPPGSEASLPRLPLGGRRQETPSIRERPRRVPLLPEGMGSPTCRPQGPLPAACLRLSLLGPQDQPWRVHRLEPACLAISWPWAGLPPSIWHTHSPGTPGPCYLQTQV